MWRPQNLERDAPDTFHPCMFCTNLSICSHHHPPASLLRVCSDLHWVSMVRWVWLLILYNSFHKKKYQIPSHEINFKNVKSHETNFKNVSNNKTNRSIRCYTKKLQQHSNLVPLILDFRGNLNHVEFLRNCIFFWFILSPVSVRFPDKFVGFFGKHFFKKGDILRGTENPCAIFGLTCCLLWDHFSHGYT